MDTMKWSKTEKGVVRAALGKAHERECRAIAEQVRQMLDAIEEPCDVWEIGDYLRKKRKEVDRKYDCRYSVVFFSLAMLLREKWLDLSDLEGLREDKIRRLDELTKSVPE